MMKKVANFGGEIANNLRQRGDSNNNTNSGRNPDSDTNSSTPSSKITDHVLGQTTTKIHTSYKPLALELLNFKDGSLSSRKTYANGIETGPSERYYENGQLWTKGNLKSGKRGGIWKFYHKNGRLSIEGIYQAGIENGIWKFFSRGYASV